MIDLRAIARASRPSLPEREGGLMVKKSTISGAFAWRLIEMLESPPYRALSLSAHRAMACTAPAARRKFSQALARDPLARSSIERWIERNHRGSSARSNCQSTTSPGFFGGYRAPREERHRQIFRGCHGREAGRANHCGRRVSVAAACNGPTRLPFIAIERFALRKM
jgi:hypothetical protein